MKFRRARTPMMLQMEAVECGAASLGMILGYYKKYIPLEELRVACGVSRDGSNVLNLKKAAEKYGLIARAYRRSAEEILSTPAPYIVFWDYNHFLVVEGVKKNKVYINDPAGGPAIIPLEQFKKRYSGVALTFKKTADFYGEGRAPSAWPGIWSRIRLVKRPLIFLLIVGFTFMLSTALIPMLTKVFFDTIVGLKVYDWGYWFFVLFGVIILLVALFALLQQLTLIRLNGKLSIQNSGQYLWHILHLPLAFYQQRFGGEIGYRLSLNEEVIDDITGKLANVVLNCIFIFIYAALLIWFNLLIALVGIVAVCINVAAVFMVQKKVTNASYFQKHVWGKFIGFAIGGISQIETIKALGRENSFFGRLSGHFSQYVNAEQRIARLRAPISPIYSLLTMLTNAALFGIGGYLFIYEGFTLGMFMAAQGLVSSFMQPVGSLVELGVVLQNVQTNISRLEDVLKNPTDPVYLQSVKVHTQPKKLEGEIELVNLTFGYSPLAPPLIEDFNLTIEPGKRIALVGPTGCGKTTITRLTNGLLQPWSGEILVGKHRRNEIAQTTLSQLIATIDQDIFLFSGSLKDNLTLFDTTISERSLIKAAKDAEIHEEVLQKPHGYNFTLTEGGMNLSGGQRQRLEIARGLLINPKILILDEATSALDSGTEERIMNNIRRRGFTCLMVAHRLSTVRDCDEIIVLEQGKVVQRGTHQQLKAAKGLYQELVQLESEENE